MKTPGGIIVTSPAPQSGKTVVCAGLAGEMLSMGLQVEAVKPLVFDRFDEDTDYFELVTKRSVYYEKYLPVNKLDFDRHNWAGVIKRFKTLSYPAIVEFPGCVSSPLRIDGNLIDCVDFAKELGWPILLVADSSERPYEQVSQALAYLCQQSAHLLGFILTASKEADNPSTLDEITSYLMLNSGTAHLGTIPYSPSISVEEKNQGNNIKLIRNNIDLYPVQAALDLIVV